MIVGYNDNDNNGDTAGFGGGKSDDGGDDGAGNRGNESNGGEGGGQFDLGVKGPQSHVDEDGNFIGVSGPDLDYAEKVVANLKTNFSIAWGKFKEKSLLSKIGIGLTAVSNPTVAAITAVALGVKSLAQALDDPGLSDGEKKGVKEGVDKFNNLPDEDREKAVEDFQTLADTDTTDTTDDTPVEPGPTRDFWNTLVDEFYGTGDFKVPAQYRDVVSANYKIDDVESNGTTIDESGNIVTPDGQKIDEQDYFSKKADQLNKAGNLSAQGGKWTASDVEKGFSDAGLTAEEHFSKYGKTEGIEPKYVQTMAGNQMINSSFKDLVYGSTNHMANAGRLYQKGLTEANAKQTNLFDELIARSRDQSADLETAQGKQDSILDGLVADAQGGTGYYKPFNFRLMGQDQSFVPKANRDTAEQVAGFGQQGYDNASNTFTQLQAAGANEGNFGQKTFDNTSSALKDILASASLTDPSNAGTKYLDSLMNMATEEEKRRAADSNETYRNDALDKGIAVTQQQIDASKPGTFDQAVGFATLWNAANSGGDNSILEALKGLLD